MEKRLVWVDADGNIIAVTADGDDNNGRGTPYPYYDGEVSINQLYWDGARVNRKPDKPGDDYYWDVDAQQWLVLQVPMFFLPPPELKDYPIFVKIYDRVAAIDVVLAEALTYILAKAVQNTEEADRRYIRLQELLNDASNNN